ncbi:LysR substrate-binding domain-containing protein [Variovorax sp. LT1R16]|uniref:LysR substrate-binding domain-containing protein n=1 Tax=Variovorax sp. LT1R16 TaxID=3443728 RepID=UPI003F446943
MLKQSERHAPCAAVAVDGGRALVDPNDFSDVTLQALVGEAHALADAEVLLVMDLRRRPQRCDTVAGVQSSLKGLLSVTAPIRFGAIHVVPVINEFLARYAGIRVQAQFSDHRVNLAVGDIDVAVRIGVLPDSGYHAIPVGSLRHVCCASPAYLAQVGTPSQPFDLPGDRIVASVGGWTSLEWRFSKASPATIQVQPRLTCNNSEAAVAAVVGGAGIARLLSYQVAREIEQGRLVSVLDAFPQSALPVNVIHREGRTMSARTRSFVELAVERLRATPALQQGR